MGKSVTGGFPHCPQVFPQVKRGKPLINRGFIRGDGENYQFLLKSVEKTLVYRTLLKLHLGGENPCVSGRGICLRKGAVHFKNFAFAVA